MVDLHEGDGGAGEENCDEQKELSAPDVTQRPDQGGREEAEDPLDAKDEPIHEEGVVGKGLVEDRDHGGGEETPGKELEEDHHQGVVD